MRKLFIWNESFRFWSAFANFMIKFHETFLDQNRFLVRTQKPQERKNVFAKCKNEKNDNDRVKMDAAPSSGVILHLKNGGGMPNLWTLGWNCLKQCIRFKRAWLVACLPFRLRVGEPLAERAYRVDRHVFRPRLHDQVSVVGEQDGAGQVFHRIFDDVIVASALLLHLAIRLATL